MKQNDSIAMIVMLLYAIDAIIIFYIFWFQGLQREK